MKSFILKFLSKILKYIQKSNEYKIVTTETYFFKKIGVNSLIPSPSLIKNPYYISIGDNFQSLYNLRIEAWDGYMNQSFSPEIIIGNNVSCNTDVHIGCINKVEIKDNVMIASRVYISDHSHGNPDFSDIETIANHRKLYSKGPVIIEENVWIGEGVCILPGVTIGKNSVIGANAVVTSSFPAYSIIAGVPARLLKTVK